MRQYRYLNIIILSAVIFSVALVLFRIETVGAKTPDEPCKGLDIVFLVSQAGSIRNHDWYNARTDGIRSAIDMLGDNAIFFCPGFQHRIAVIGFGDISGDDPDYRMYIEPTQVNPKLETIEQWTQVKGQMKRSIPDRDPYFYENYTRYANNAAALEAASLVFKKWKDEAIPSPGPRHRALVWITDGNMITEKNGANFRVTINGNQDTVGLRDILDPNGSEFPWRGEDNESSIHIYLIGMFSEGGGYEFLKDPIIKPFLEDVTRQHNGEFIYKPITETEHRNFRLTNAQISSQIATVMNSLLGSDLKKWDCSKPIWVEPYISSVQIFHIFRFGADEGNNPEDVRVQIVVVQGEKDVAAFERGGRISGEMGEVGDYTTSSGGLSERYLFYSPPPGKYMIKVQGANACEDIEVQIGSRALTEQVLAPLIEDKLIEEYVPDVDTVNSPYMFRVQLTQPTEENGVTIQTPLVEIPGHPLDIKVNVSGRSDVIEPVSYSYPLVRMDDRQAIYESRTPGSLEPLFVDTRHPGHYDWVMVGTTIMTKEMTTTNTTKMVAVPIEVFRRTGTFTIVPKDWEVAFRLLNPIEKADIPLLDGIASSSIPVEVQVIHPNGDPLREDLSIADPGAQPFEAVLINSLGERVSSARLNIKDGTTNIYTTELTSGVKEQPLGFKPDCYTVEVTLTDEYRKSVYIFQEKKQTSVPLCMYLAQRFSWKVVSPEMRTPDQPPYPIHPPLKWFPPANPVKIALEVTSPDGTQVLPVDDLLKDGAGPLFTGELQVPGREKPFELEFQPDQENDLFITKWPEGADRRGGYQLKVFIHPEAVPVTRISVKNDPETVSFHLADTYLSVPWALLMWIILAGILVLFAFLLWLRNGPLYGAVLSFTAGRGVKVPVVGEVRLFKYLRTRGFTVNSKQAERDISGGQIQGIKVKPVKPTKEEARVAVDLTIIWSDDSSMPVPKVNEGDEVGILPGVKMAFGRNPSSFLGRSGLLLFIELIILVLWAATYYGLFIRT